MQNKTSAIPSWRKINNADIQLPEFFRSDRFYLTVIIVLSIFTFLRGLRQVSQWAATQLLWNYEFGFVKRALVGHIISLLPGNYSYEKISYVCFAILLIEISL